METKERQEEAEAAKENARDHHLKGTTNSSSVPIHNGKRIASIIEAGLAEMQRLGKVGRDGH